MSKTESQAGSMPGSLPPAPPHGVTGRPEFAIWLVASCGEMRGYWCAKVILTSQIENCSHDRFSWLHSMADPLLVGFVFATISKLFGGGV